MTPKSVFRKTELTLDILPAYKTYEARLTWCLVSKLAVCGRGESQLAAVAEALIDPEVPEYARVWALAQFTESDVLEIERCMREIPWKN